MDTVQACQILGIEVGASKEDVDKAFKKMAVKYHPDKNKDNQEEAEAKFKEANQAYQLLKEYGTQPRVNFGPSFNDISSRDFMNDFFSVNFSNFTGPFRRQSMRREIPMGVVDISFVESISGCRKEIPITRQVNCTTCNGSGVTQLISDVKCEKCKGEKRVNVNGKDLPCTRCGATGFAKRNSACGDCNQTGSKTETKRVIVGIPAGVESGNSIRIKGEGGIINGTPADAILRVSVEKDPDLQKDGNDVISCITIPLLDALKGCSKEVRTAYGSKTLKIKPGIKNNDTVRVRGFGVGNAGSHVFNIKVEYPNDTEPLIELLENYPEKN